MQVLFLLGYLLLGILQLAAVMAGLEEWIGLPSLLAGAVALFVAYIPLVGTALGIVGAVTAWGWPWLQAVALFFGPFVVLMAVGALCAGSDAIPPRKDPSGDASARGRA